MFSVSGKILMLLCIFLTCLGTSLAINITDCGSNGQVNYINYTGCRNYSEEVCYIEKGTFGNLTVEFTPVEQVFALTVRAFGILGGFEYPLYIKNPDVCLESAISCPVPAHAIQTYSTEIELKENLPQVSAEVRWELQDQRSTNIICLTFPVQVV